MADISGFNVGGQYVSPELYGIYEKQTHTGKVSGLLVKQNTTPNMTVLVEPGIALLDKGSFSSVVAGVKSNTSLTIATANPSNPRIDAIVVYEDIAVTMPSVEPYSVDASNGRFKMVVVAGTPGAVPTDPSDPTIQSTIGAGNTSWTRLATVRVEAGTTTIINSKIDNSVKALLMPILPSSEWTAWTHNFAGFTGGSVTVTAKYIKIGKIVHFRLKAVLGDTPSAVTNFTFSLPVTAHSDYTDFTALNSTAALKDANGGYFVAQMYAASTTQLIVRMVDPATMAAASPTTTAPFTWASGDSVTVAGTYEAA